MFFSVRIVEIQEQSSSHMLLSSILVVPTIFLCFRRPSFSQLSVEGMYQQTCNIAFVHLQELGDLGNHSCGLVC